MSPTMRILLTIFLLAGCTKSLPPENYGITETYRVCDERGQCHKVTQTTFPFDGHDLRQLRK